MRVYHKSDDSRKDWLFGMQCPSLCAVTYVAVYEGHTYMRLTTRVTFHAAYLAGWRPAVRMRSMRRYIREGKAKLIYGHIGEFVAGERLTVGQVINLYQRRLDEMEFKLATFKMAYTKYYDMPWYGECNLIKDSE